MGPPSCTKHKSETVVGCVLRWNGCQVAPKGLRIDPINVGWIHGSSYFLKLFWGWAAVRRVPGGFVANYLAPEKVPFFFTPRSRKVPGFEHFRLDGLPDINRHTTQRLRALPNGFQWKTPSPSNTTPRQNVWDPVSKPGGEIGPLGCIELEALGMLIESVGLGALLGKYLDYSNRFLGVGTHIQGPTGS